MNDGCFTLVNNDKTSWINRHKSKLPLTVNRLDLDSELNVSESGTLTPIGLDIVNCAQGKGSFEQIWLLKTRI